MPKASRARLTTSLAVVSYKVIKNKKTVICYNTKSQGRALNEAKSASRIFHMGRCLAQWRSLDIV